MKTISRVTLALVGMTGLAAAQPRPSEPKPPQAKPPEAKPAEPAAGMPQMKPPQELADMAKAAGGTWRCKGQGMDMTMKMANLTGTLRMKLDLDKWWFRSTFDSRMGKDQFRFESFTTFDPASKKWKRVMVDNGGGWSTGESAGLVNNKVDWDLTSHGPMGESMFRDHEDLADLKAGVKMWGEFSMDKGKTWTKVYEMTCKK